jgi:hypothetical protein
MAWPEATISRNGISGLGAVWPGAASRCRRRRKYGGRNAQDRQRCHFQDSIHVAVASDSIRPLVRRIVQLDRDDWRQGEIAYDEVNMLGADSIEVCSPEAMALIGIDQIS